MDYHQEEVLESIKPAIKENLKYLAGVESKNWWPAQFFSFMEEEDYEAPLRSLRDQAKTLDDELLIVLIGDMVTEEALPNYSITTQYTAQDGTGVSEDPFSVWQRGWAAEENSHGDVLHNYLLLTGRVNMTSVNKSIHSLIESGFKQDPSLYMRLFYPMFQEPATRVSHNNVGKLAKVAGDETLSKLCRKIAGDEHRHAMFYLGLGKALFNQDPSESILQFYNLMKEGIVMPAHLMTDGIYKEPPTLFDNFANIALDIGVYTPFDYADILEKLNLELNIPNLPVSGEASKAQEYISKLPDRIRRVGEMKKKKKRFPKKFEWLYGREV